MDHAILRSFDGMLQRMGNLPQQRNQIFNGMLLVDVSNSLRENSFLLKNILSLHKSEKPR